MKSAGPRKSAPTRYLPTLPGSAPGGGAATTGGSTATPPALNALLALLVGRCRGGLELLLDPGDVLRVPQEGLEDPPLALSGGGAERRRLLVRHVEHDRLRLPDRGLGRPGDRIRVDARRDVLVARAEAALLRPRLGGGSGGEELDECLDRRGVAERDQEIAADLDRARVRSGCDRRPGEGVEAGVRLRFRR